MKYSLLLLVCFIILCSLSFCTIHASEDKINKILIYIDPGHGGVDPGVVVNNIYEKDINLKISFALKEKLEQNNIEVLMTRSGDYDLGTPKATYRKKSDFDHRIQLINDSKADYYLSIHLNYLSDSSYYGPQVFYNDTFETNKILADKIQKTLNEKIGTNRQIIKIPNSTYMYSKLDIPGVLIECGFLSNVNERKKLLTESYIDEFTSYLVDVFKNF